MDKRRVILHPRVPEDLIEIVDYLDQRSPAAADRFAQGMRDSLEQISEFPGIGSPKQFDDSRLANVRSWYVKGFRKYLIFYHIVQDDVKVLAVLHGARAVGSILGARAENLP
jgi:toxin ParE1/3/4